MFEYFVNLDERGEFFADVRSADGDTVFEIHGFDINARINSGNSISIDRFGSITEAQFSIDRFGSITEAQFLAILDVLYEATP